MTQPQTAHELAEKARHEVAALVDMVHADWAVEEALLEDAEAATVPAGVDAPQPRTHLRIRSLREVEAQDIQWFWRRFLAQGKFGLLGGYAGDGKSTLLASLAASASHGKPWPDGSLPPRPLRTLFLLGEDAAGDTLKPRLALHDADMDQIFTLDAVLDEQGRERFFNVERHLELLDAAVIELGIDWLVVDPLTTITPGSDRNAEADVRDGLTPLIKLGERRNLAITGIAHVGKGSGTQRRAMQKILGATAYHAMARTVWMIAPDADGRLVLGVVKSNLATTPPSLAFSRDEDAPIRWHGVSEQDVEELIDGAPVSTPRADAEGFLREFLAGGSRSSEDVERAAKEYGVAGRTLRRAADAIGIKKFKEPGRLNGRWFWSLPEGEPRHASPSTDADATKLSTLDSPGQVRVNAKLATPRETEVANFATSNMATTNNGGHIHETTPLFAGSEVGHLSHEDGQATEGGHSALLRAGHLHNGDSDGEVIAMAKRLAELTPDELRVFREEVATAPPNDPNVPTDRQALALFEAMRAAGAIS